jgi:hypothetical protein
MLAKVVLTRASAKNRPKIGNRLERVLVWANVS